MSLRHYAHRAATGAATHLGSSGPKGPNLDDWRAIGDDLQRFRRSLDRGRLSGLTVQQQAAAAKALYDKTLAGVNARDKDALAAYPQVAADYLEAARAAATDGEAYARILSGVKADTAAAQAYAAMQVSAAEAELAALQTMVSKLIDIDTSIQAGTSAVVSAVNALASALTSQAVANDNGYTTVPDWFDWSTYWSNNPDLARNRAAGGILAQYGSDMEAAIAHFLNTGQHEIAKGTRGFRTGGGFRVGGFGGADSQLVQFRASPGELVDVHYSSTLESVDSQLSRLSAATSATAKALQRIERHTRETAKVQRRWDGDGLPDTRNVA